MNKISKALKVAVLAVLVGCFFVIFLLRLDPSRPGRLTQFSEQEVRNFELRGKSFEEVRGLMGDPYDVMVTDDPHGTTDWMYKNLFSQDRERPRYIFINFQNGKVEAVLFNYRQKL